MASTPTHLTRPSRAADNASKIAVDLIKGVARIPAGPKRAKECGIRRARVFHGIDTVLTDLELVEQAFSGGEAGACTLQRELDFKIKVLGWCAMMTNGLQTAARTLETLDTYEAPELEYSQIASHLEVIKEVLKDLCLMLEGLDAAGHDPVGSSGVGVTCSLRDLSAFKHSAGSKGFSHLSREGWDPLSETCSTASCSRSGGASSASSYDSLDSPKYPPVAMDAVRQEGYGIFSKSTLEEETFVEPESSSDNIAAEEQDAPEVKFNALYDILYVI